MFPNLSAEMARIKVTKTDIANLLGVSLKTIYKKLETGTFTVVEALKITETFFPNKSVGYLFSDQVEDDDVAICV